MQERPSATDLGISEEVYRRVLQDVEQRSAEEQLAPPTTPRNPWRLSGRSWASVGALALALVVVLASVPPRSGPLLLRHRSRVEGQLSSSPG